jgi:tetratricopeptide (TPR) repeat protein
MAQVCERAGDRRAAQEHRRAAADAPPDLSWPAPFNDEVKRLETGEHANLAQVSQLMMQRRLGEAVALLEQTVTDYPLSARAWAFLGDALLRTRDLQRAEQALKQAAELGSTSVEVPYDLGRIFMLRGDARTALEYFRQAIKHKPDFALAHNCIGRCSLKEGDRQGALVAFETALRCKPDLIEARRAAAELLIMDGKSAQALDHLGYAYAFAPNDTRVKQLLRQVLQHLSVPTGFYR